MQYGFPEREAFAAGMMKRYGGAIDVGEVGREVGNVRNNRSGLLERVGLV